VLSTSPLRAGLASDPADELVVVVVRDVDDDIEDPLVAPALCGLS